jgi:hypothetical protein
MKRHGLGDLNMTNKTKPNYVALWHETPCLGDLSMTNKSKQNKLQAS